MKRRLALSLAGAHLRLDVLPTAVGGVANFVRSLLRGGELGAGEAPEPIARIEIAGAIAYETVRSRLDAAMVELRGNSQASFAGSDLVTQLGLDHARIGLMVLKDVSASGLTTSTRQAYVMAWVRQMLHLNPDTQVIRWQVLADAHKMLISCVDRRIFDVVNEFALEHGLHFVSCRPAILSAAQAEGGVPGESTIVWTESGVGACRSSSVQLLRLSGGHISLAWRGWVPPSEGDDEALEGAVRRFQARQPPQAAGALKHLHWPVEGKAHVRP